MVKITRKTVRILPALHTARPRARTRTPSAPPRRSRRVAGFDPVPPAAGTTNTRNKKNVMRALHVIEENEGINQEALDEYSMLFGHPLPESHVQALAALFGWATPEEVDMDS